MLKIGHRGACGYEPENTLISFAKAIVLGVDMIELDVYICKSAEVVVFHDSDLKRMTGKEGEIENMTLKELQNYKLSKNQTIPTLKEVLDLVNARVMVNIELKGKGTRLKVNSIISEYCTNGWRKEQFLVSSFDMDELREFKKINSGIYVGLLFESLPKNIDKLIEELQPYAINLDVDKLKIEEIQYIKNQNIKVLAYTVNDVKKIKELKEWGVDGIFSDFPDRL